MPHLTVNQVPLGKHSRFESVVVHQQCSRRLTGLGCRTFNPVDTGSNPVGSAKQCGTGILVVASAFQAEETGSIPVSRSNDAGIAQLVEHCVANAKAVGSSPITCSKFQMPL